MKKLLLLAVLASTPAFANPKQEAKVHIDKATAFHGEGKFKEALDELTLAYALDPKPELLYAIGQVHVQLGNCQQAISFYQRFLSTKPAAGPASAAKEAIQTCKTSPPKTEPVKTEPVKTEPVKTEPAKIEPVKTEPVKTEPVKTEPPPPVEPVKTEPPPPHLDPIPPRKEEPVSTGPKPWYKDVIGDALVAGGVGAGVASVIFYLGAKSKLDDAENKSIAMTYQEHQDLRDEAKSKRNLSLVFGGAGVVLIGAGVVHYMLRDTGEHRNKVAVTPTSDGGLITWMGRF